MVKVATDKSKSGDPVHSRRLGQQNGAVAF